MTSERSGMLIRGYRVNNMDPHPVGRFTGVTLIPSNCGRHMIPLRDGEVVTNINLSASREHVTENYAVHDKNVLLTFSFYEEDITRGSLDDNEVEVTLDKATLIAWEVIDERAL